MSYEFCDEYFKNIGNLLESGTNSDVIIQAGEGNTYKEFPDPVGLLQMVLQHKACNSFRNAFIKTTYEDVDILKKDPYGLLQLILQHEACAAHRDPFIKAILMDVNVIKKDLARILQITYANEACTTLRDSCVLISCIEAITFFESPSFLKLNANNINEILLWDFINLEEIRIWNYLLKWGAAQSSLDLNNRNEWTTDDFQKLRDILQRLVPFIRWFQIPAADFRKEMKLFKCILPEELFLDVVGYSLDPTSSPNTVILPPRIYSSLINKDQFQVITDQINKRSAGEYKGYFRLLYRASRDGFEADEFHKLCDDKGATIFLAKCQGFDKIIGGYNPFSWKAYSLRTSLYERSWEDTKESFLFTLDGLSLDHVAYPDQDSKYAVSYSNNSGPCFGRVLSFFSRGDK
ncbi:7222_t:CDS:2, partial [Acaulospora colombiana]